MECLQGVRGVGVRHEILAYLVFIHCSVPCLNQGGVIPNFLVREFTILYAYCFDLEVTEVVVVRERHVVIFHRLVPVDELLWS